MPRLGRSPGSAPSHLLPSQVLLPSRDPSAKKAGSGADGSPTDGLLLLPEAPLSLIEYG